jgi:PAS domain-containing protein
MTTAFDNPLLNDIPDALVSTTSGNEAVDWNKRAETDLTYRSAEAVRRLLNEIIAPPDRVEEEGGMLRRQRR